MGLMDFTEKTSPFTAGEVPSPEAGPWCWTYRFESEAAEKENTCSSSFLCKIPFFPEVTTECLCATLTLDVSRIFRPQSVQTEREERKDFIFFIQ